jgi:Skp family chaperone for outer membrane proteins
MNIKPLAQGTGVLPGDDSSQRTSSQRIAAAKAIAAGQERPAEVAPSSKAETSLKRLKMATKATPGPALPQEAYQAQQESISQPAQSDGDVQASAEVIKPLDPQAVALAKQRRALQVKEREIAEREKALASAPDWKSTLKANPLSALQDAGLTYDDLTQAILSSQNSPEIQQLRDELKSLKDGVDKTLSERDAQAEQQVLNDIQRNINNLVAQGDTYELVRETQSQPTVKELIHRTWKSTGEVLSESEACALVETELLNDALKLAKLSKIQQKIAPPTPQPQMKTLTSRDGARPMLDRKARAMAAFYGK